MGCCGKLYHPGGNSLIPPSLVRCFYIFGSPCICNRRTSIRACKPRCRCVTYASASPNPSSSCDTKPPLGSCKAFSADTPSQPDQTCSRLLYPAWRIQRTPASSGAGRSTQTPGLASHRDCIHQGWLACSLDRSQIDAQCCSNIIENRTTYIQKQGFYCPPLNTSRIRWLSRCGE